MSGLRFSVMALVLAATGCSSLANEADNYNTKILLLGDPNTPKDAVPDWSCLDGTGPSALPPTNYPALVTYTFPFVEWLTNNAIPGRTIQVCNLIDPTCNPPLAAETSIVEGQKDVSVQIQAGQNVFLLLKAPGYIDDALYFDGPLYSDQTGGRIQLLTVPVISNVAQSARIPLDPTLGVMAIRPHDCLGQIVGGIKYTIDPNPTSIPYTIVNGLVTADNPAVPDNATSIPNDNSPWAGFTNVPAMQVTVHGFLADSMREIGSATVPVRGGTVSGVEVRALNHL